MFPSPACTGGQTALRQSWAQYFTSARCVILVVDSTDRARIGLVKAELGKLLEADVRRSSSSFSRM
jgi:ADP-ribosylation factor-like protein 5B